MAYQETYQYAWAIYLLSSLGLYYVVVKLSKYWKSEDRINYFRMISAVVLFTPASTSINDISAIAPAYIVLFGELLTNGFKASMAGLVPLLLAMFVCALVLALQAYLKSKKAAQSES